MSMGMNMGMSMSVSMSISVGSLVAGFSQPSRQEHTQTRLGVWLRLARSGSCQAFLTFVYKRAEAFLRSLACEKVFIQRTAARRGSGHRKTFLPFP